MVRLLGTVFNVEMWFDFWGQSFNVKIWFDFCGQFFNVEIWFDFLGQFLMLKFDPTVGDQNLTGVNVLRVDGSLINRHGSVFNVKNLSIIG